MHLRSLWKKYRSAHTALYSKRKMPVFVYQMGKVGSSSVRNSLWSWGVDPVLHLHSFFPLRNIDLDAIMIENGYKEGLREEIDEAKRVFKNFSYQLKFEWLLREKIDEMLYKKIVKKKKKAKFITLVREPVSTNISMFFQVFPHHCMELTLYSLQYLQVHRGCRGFQGLQHLIRPSPKSCLRGRGNIHRIL